MFTGNDTFSCCVNMERSPLRELEDLNNILQPMEENRDICKRQSEDKQNVQTAANKRCRRSILRTFDPNYHSCSSGTEELDDDSVALTEGGEVYSKDSFVDVTNTTTVDTSVADLYVTVDESVSDCDRTDCVTTTCVDGLCEPEHTGLENTSVSVVSFILDNLFKFACDTSEFAGHHKSVVCKIAVPSMSGAFPLDEHELSELKLQLNQSQQVIATLELQLRQKEEIIIKTEAEFQKRDIKYKQEIKLFQEKLSAIEKVKNDDEVKQLKECVEKMKTQEKKQQEQLNKLTSEEEDYKQVMDGYEQTMTYQFKESEKLKREHDTVQRHLATLEVAFADVHAKYERCKLIIGGYKTNEEAMQQSLQISNDLLKKNEEKYQSLKAHAKAQIEKSNKELNLLREKSQIEISKLMAIIKRLEIKQASLVNALEQKTKECTALASLCDEVTGHVGCAK